MFVLKGQYVDNPQRKLGVDGAREEDTAPTGRDMRRTVSPRWGDR